MRFIREGGSSTRHAAPPVGLLLPSLKWKPFSLRRTREVVPQHTLQNVLLRLPSPPPPLPAEFPKTGTWQDGGGSTQGFRGVTHRVTNPMHPRTTTTGKGGDAEGTPPTNPSVCFPSSSYVMLFLFSMLMSMTASLTCPLWLKWTSGVAPLQKGRAE